VSRLGVRRVLVTGITGAGKTTLARAVAETVLSGKPGR
jgi:adenylate kinase family enzyme